MIKTYTAKRIIDEYNSDRFELTFTYPGKDALSGKDINLAGTKTMITLEQVEARIADLNAQKSAIIEASN